MSSVTGSGSLATSFLGALQASVSVLLTVFYGVLAAQFELVQGSSTENISRLCVNMLMPALLITSVGEELNAGTLLNYAQIMVWSLACIIISIALSGLMTWLFKFPNWVTPAIAFNNTTSLPLLLIQALDRTGILSRLIISDSDSSAEALKRANSYFLVASIVSNSFTSALTPGLMGGLEVYQDDEDRGGSHTEEDGLLTHEDAGEDPEARQEDGAAETTTLLPDNILRLEQATQRQVSERGKKYWHKMSPRTKSYMNLLYAFFNPPMIGAVIGIVVGLVPGLHKAFFASPDEGGFFNAWITSSVGNIGDLFATLQVVIVGVKLSSSLRKFMQGEDSGHVPWLSALFALTARFVIWPAISISVIWAVAKNTNLLVDDPMMWFVMMLIPCGPSAMGLIATAEAQGVQEMEMMAISKFLTISYMVSPLMCFTVVLSLSSAQNAIS